MTNQLLSTKEYKKNLRGELERTIADITYTLEPDEGWGYIEVDGYWVLYNLKEYN